MLHAPCMSFSRAIIGSDFCPSACAHVTTVMGCESVNGNQDPGCALRYPN